MAQNMLISKTSDPTLEHPRRLRKLSHTVQRTKSSAKTATHSNSPSTTHPNDVASLSVPKHQKDQARVMVCKLSLEKEAVNRQLMDLRRGASNALREKDQQIDKLKERFEEARQQLGKKEQEWADKQYLIQLGLDEQRYRLRSLQTERRRERTGYLVTVSTKDRAICDLGEELEATKGQIANLQESSYNISLKLSQVQEQTQNLTDELLRMRTDVCVLRESLKRSQIFSEKPCQTQTKTSLALQIPTEQSIQIEEESEMCMQVRKQKIKNAREKERNRRQAQDLRLYYEMRLLRLQKKTSSITEELAEYTERAQKTDRSAYFQRQEDILIEDRGEQPHGGNMRMELQSQRSHKSYRSQRSDRSADSQFSSKLFYYQPHAADRDDLNSNGSLKTRRALSSMDKFGSKHSSRMTQLEDIEQLYQGFDRPEDNRIIWKVVAGVVISVVVVGLFFKLRK